MKAVVTAGNGGYDKLQCRVVNLPTLEPGEIPAELLDSGADEAAA